MTRSDDLRKPGFAGMMMILLLAACLAPAASGAPLHRDDGSGAASVAACRAALGGAAADSLQLAKLRALEARQDSLQKRLRELQDEQNKGTRPEKEVQADISATVDAVFAVSKEITQLSDAMESGGVVDLEATRGADAGEMQEGGGERAVEGEESFASSWDAESGPADEDDEQGQFDFRPDRFLKRSAVYPWLFPRESRLCESSFRYNRVEGFYLGVAQPKRLYWKSQPRLVGTGSLGYGFASHRWRYSLGLFLPLYMDNHIVEFGVEGYSFTDSRDQWLVDRDENTAMALFAREDFMDYFGREGFTASASWYARSENNTTIKAGIAYVHDTYESLPRNAEWSLFGGDKVFRANPAISDGNINSIVISAGLNSDVSFARCQQGWNVQASLEMAGDFAKGDHSFTQIVLDARRYQPLLDFLTLNLRYRLGAGDGAVPLQRSFNLGGLGTLPGYRYKEFSGTHAMLINSEFIFHAGSTADMHGWVAKVLGAINLILFFDAGAVNEQMTVSTWRGSSPVYQNTLGDGFTLGEWKTDAGIAIGSHDGDFRIGAAWRLDHPSSPALVVRLARPF